MNTTTTIMRAITCPACGSDIMIEITIGELSPTSSSMPDPRQEGKVTLTGKITGTKIQHDCNKKVTR